MKLFETSLIDRLILSILQEYNSLPHADIVIKLANELNLSQEEREEKEQHNPTVKAFYHMVAGRESSLQRRHFIINNKSKKEWEILPEGVKNHNASKRIVSDYSVLQVVYNHISKVFPELEPYNKRKALNYEIKTDTGKKHNIGLLCKDKLTNDLIVIEVEKDKQTMHDHIKLVSNKHGINIEHVHGILIKTLCEGDSNSQTIQANSSDIETRYFMIDVKIFDEGKEIPIDDDSFEIQPNDENALSDYLSTPTHIKKIAPELHNCSREYPINGKRIDILCRDDKDNYVIIENKKNDSDYKVVGQVLYYIDQVKNENIKDNNKDKKVKAIILMSQKLQNSTNVSTVKSALNCCPELGIDLKFYRMSIRPID